MLRSSGFEKFSSLYHNLYLSNLIEFITAISVTPTSANTASHIVAIPIRKRQEGRKAGFTKTKYS